jgi:hypothetical protein
VVAVLEAGMSQPQTLTVGGHFVIAAPESYPIRFFDSVLVLTPQGEIIWHGRTVETDAELRQAVIDVRDYILGTLRPK